MTSTPIFVPFTRSLLLIAAIAAPGCTPPMGDLGEYTATEATGGGTEATTDTGETTGETASDATGEPEFPGCIPGDPTLEVGLDVDAPTLITPDSFEFDVTCAVDSVSSTEIALQCTDDAEVVHAVVLTVATPTPKTGLLGGQTQVRMRYRHAEWQEFELDIRTHVSLHSLDGDVLLLFYGAGLNLFEPGFADFWAPLQIADGDLGACPAEVDDTGCQTIERVPLEVDVDGEQAELFDGAVAAFAPTSLWFYVERSVDQVQVDFEGCFDLVDGRSVEVLALVADL